MTVSWLLFLTALWVQSAFSQDDCQISISQETWGVVFDPLTKSNKTVTRYTLSNCNKIKVQVITFGASITSIVTPDDKGNLTDIALGFDDMKGYQSEENAYLGATLGRVANRIGYATFKLPVGNVTVQYNLTKNNGDNTIHGGVYSFGKVFWIDCSGKSKTSVTLCHESLDGEGGFPGTVKATVSYSLNKDNELKIKFRAEASKPTPINMANHAYLNLAGHKTGSEELYEHVVQINADKYTPIDKLSLPTGEIKSVDGTPFDLRNWTNVGLALALNFSSGIDHNFVLSCREKDPTSQQPCLAARIYHPDSNRMLSVFTTQPGLQFYTANTLSATGKDNTYYGKHASFSMETQHFPDSVNHPNFPNTIIYPNKPYSHEMIYKFEVRKV